MPCPVPAHPGGTDLVRNWWGDGFIAQTRSVACTTLGSGSDGPGWIHKQTGLSPKKSTQEARESAFRTSAISRACPL